MTTKMTMVKRKWWWNDERQGILDNHNNNSIFFCLSEITCIYSQYHALESNRLINNKK